MGVREDLFVGQVVQIDPEYDPGGFGGCFLVVTEVKTWGVQGYVSIPGRTGLAYYRVRNESFAPIGRAEWATARGDES